MSSKRAIRRRACTGKTRHASAAAAYGCLRSMIRGQRAEPGSLNAYRCNFCGGYHVGHRKGSGLRAA